jgi:hypothetical protein
MTPRQDRTEMTVPLAFVVPADLKPEYATHVIAQKSEQEVYINFFLANPPLAHNPPPAGLVVPAPCVARVVVSHARFRSFVEAMNLTLAQLDAPPEGANIDVE